MGCRCLIRSALNNKSAEDLVLACLLKTSGLRRRECYWAKLEETSTLRRLKIIYWDSFCFFADSDSMALAVQGWSRSSLAVFTAGVHLSLSECTNKYILNQLFKPHSVMTSSSRLALRRYAVPPGAWYPYMQVLFYHKFHSWLHFNEKKCDEDTNCNRLCIKDPLQTYIQWACQEQ